MNLRSALYVLVPVAAVGVFAAGLRVGARVPAHSAVLFAVRSHEGKTTELRVVTSYVASGVPEVKGLEDLELVMRARGRDAIWKGATNHDGVADVSLAPSEPAAGELVHLTLRGKEGELLLDEDARYPELEPAQMSTATLRATETKGELKLGVDLPQGRAVIASETHAFVHGTVDGLPVELAVANVEVDPEPGLVVPTKRRCAQSPGIELVLNAQYFVTGMRIRATANGKSGEWFGGLPVARGAPSIVVALPLERRNAIPVEPQGAQGTIYFEVVTPAGRVSGVNASYGPPGPTSVAFPLAQIPEGAYWVAASHSPRMSEVVDETMAITPVNIGPAMDNCKTSGQTMTRLPGRKLFVDGALTRRAKHLPTRRRGLTIALLGLLFGASAGSWLLLDGATRARTRLRAALVEDGAGAAAPGPARGAVMAVLLVLACFTFLAALLFLGAPT